MCFLWMESLQRPEGSHAHLYTSMHSEHEECLQLPIPHLWPQRTSTTLWEMSMRIHCNTCLWLCSSDIPLHNCSLPESFGLQPIFMRLQCNQGSSQDYMVAL